MFYLINSRRIIMIIDALTIAGTVVAVLMAALVVQMFKSRKSCTKCSGGNPG